jgi:hypothetical protein
MGRPNQTHDVLDALLDGRPGEVTDDLAPLLAAAEALRTELAEFELDPEVIDRHLEQALDRPATVVPLPVRDEGRSGGLRRRLVAVGLAAALVLVPATAASAASSSALPGQPLYRVKLAVEQVRLATVQWSATAEAHERTRLAAIRLKELDKLVQLKMFDQVPTAIRRLDNAVMAAKVAVVKAVAEEGADHPELAAVTVQLRAVTQAQFGELNELKAIVANSQAPNVQAIAVAVKASPAEAQPIPVPSPPTPAPPDPTNPRPETTSVPSTSPLPGSTPPSTEAAPETTAPTTTQPPETTAPATTTPPTTGASPDQGNASGAGGSEGTPTSSTSLN